MIPSLRQSLRRLTQRQDSLRCWTKSPLLTRRTR